MRISTQDILRSAVADTQSDESIHSTLQSPFQDGIQGSTETTNSAQNRRNPDFGPGSEETVSAKKIRSEQTPSEGQLVLHPSITPQGDLMVPL